MRYLALAFASLAFLSASGNEGSSGSAFVGAERCRLCHRPIYQAWTASAHQGATESLRAEELTPECLHCHATGPEALPGVQCEGCHGAGGNYSTPEVMMDPDKARRAGLIEPNETVCRSCHDSGLPGHSPSFSMPSDDAENARGIH